ncbi:MAG: hypothetical protein PVSMB7_29180 [Chloroflexota bacterium]
MFTVATVLSSSVSPVVEFLRSLLPGLVAAPTIVVLTYIAARWTSGRLHRGLDRRGLQINATLLLTRALWVGVWIVGFLLVLRSVGVGLTPLAAFIGVAGLAASLSLQAVLQNLVAGVYLLAERPFGIGDYIAVVGPAGTNHEGRVEDIQMRTTQLRSRDDELILIPNSSIFSGVVTNKTAVGGFAQHVTVTLPRVTDAFQARDAVMKLLEDMPEVLRHPAPRARVVKVEPESWTGLVSFWSDSAESGSQVAWAIAREYPAATVDGTTP